ncbi:acetamidase/formamidase family protein [Rhodococcus coprophilus]|uniref:acetamidase/formamidase family protein n=1 Tax=Rhodococcus coprophilus TaxID=38310 RepID=UPI0033C44C97
MLNSGMLNPGEGPIRSASYLPSTLDHLLWGRLPSRADSAVLSIDAGSEVTIDTISHEGILEDQGRDPKAFFGAHGVEDVLEDAVALAASEYPRTMGVDGPHVVTGPIEIRGAQTGDVLAMTLVEALPRVPYGVVSNRHGKGALPQEYPQGTDVFSVFAALDENDPTRARMSFGPGDTRSASFPIAPFLGIMGVAVDSDERPHSVPPGAHGGNIDINLLTAGATLYLPIQVPGALAYIGDPHFAQGDGEVSLTALEASLRATIRFDVVPREEALEAFGDLVGPIAETSEYLIPTGLDKDLDLAVQNCVRAAIGLLEARYGMDPRHAYAYLSAATDFNISQVVDVVKGVHARIRKDGFA